MRSLRFGNLLPVLLLVAACVAPVTDVSAQDARVERNRAHTETIKETVFAALAEGLGTRLQAQTPSTSRVSVYLDVGAPDLLLEKASLSLDGQPLVTQTYTKREAWVLVGAAVHRVARINVSPGEHRLEVNFDGVRDPAGEAGHFSGTLEIYFEKERAAKALILPLSPQVTAFAGAVPRWKWQAEPEDARLGMVRFLRGTGQRLAALLELLEIRGAAARPEDLPAGYHGLAAHAYVDFKMPNDAARALRLAAESQTERKTRDRAALRLADLLFRFGRYAPARDWLQNVGPHLTDADYPRWRDLHARTALAMGDYASALVLLQTQTRGLAQAPYSFYNQAVALAGLGRAEESGALLERLGQLEPASAVSAEVRNKANEVLGFSYLEQGRFNEAQKLPARLESGEPAADKLLLVNAWAQTLAKINAKTSEAQADAGPSLLSEVLPLWRRLGQGGLLQPVAQEAKLATAYTLEKFGRLTPAETAYRRALSAFEAGEQRLDRDIEALRQGRFSPVVLDENPLSALFDASWQKDLRASHGVQELIDNHQDLLILRGALAQFPQQADASLLQALRYSAQAQLGLTQTLLARGFEVQRQQLAQYQIAARLGWARVAANAR